MVATFKMPSRLIDVIRGELDEIDTAYRDHVLKEAERTFASLAHNSRLIGARLSRHFAEREPGVSDLAFLLELRADLQRVHDAMVERYGEMSRDELSRDIAHVKKWMMTASRRIAIAREIQRETIGDERTRQISTFANGELDRLAEHRSSKTKVLMRPAVLVRVAENLRQCAAELDALDRGGVRVPAVTREQLDEGARACDEALAELRRLRASTPMADLVHALDARAREALAEAVAIVTQKDRNDVDPADVGRICDELHELQRQMVDISRAYITDETYERLWLTSKQLLLLEREHGAIVRAHAPRLEPLVPRSFEAGLRATAVAAPRRNEETAPFPLLPLQARILALPHAHHWSIPLVCELAPTVSREQVDEIFHALLTQHEGLRARFTKDDSGAWRQHNDSRDSDSETLTFFCDVSRVAVEKQRATINGVLARISRENRLSNGGLCRLVLFERGHEQPRLMFMVMHHLVTDMASLSILFQDFVSSYEKLALGEAISFRRPTTSVKVLAETLAALGRDASADEAARWRAELERARPLFAGAPVDAHAPVHREKHVLLDAKQTAELLSHAPPRYNVSLDRILAATFAQALARWKNERTVGFTWIHHGRTGLPAGLNPSRTVGAIFNEAPISASIDPSAAPADLLSSFVAQHEDLAKRGLSFGTHAFYGPDLDLRERLQRHPSLQVRVNYSHLGRVFGRKTRGPIALYRDVWRAPFACGCSRFPWNLYVHLRVTEGELRVGIDRVGIDRAAAEQLVTHWRVALVDLISSSPAAPVRELHKK